MANLFCTSSLKKPLSDTVAVSTMAPCMEEGHLQYDYYRPADESQQIDQQCELCKTALSNNKRQHVIYENESHYLICDHCLSVKRLDQAPRGARLVYVPIDIQQKITHAFLNNMMVSATQAAQRGYPNAQDSLNILLELEQLFFKKYSSVTPHLLAKYLNHNQLMREIRALNKKWLNYHEAVLKKATLEFTDPEVGIISKEHTVNFKQHTKKINETERYYSALELQALKRNKNNHYHSYPLNIRLFVKRALFNDSLNKLQKKIEGYQTSNNIWINWIQRNDISLKIEEDKLREYVKREHSERIKVIEAQIAQLKKTAQKNKQNYHANVGMAERFLEKVRDYQNEMAEYRQLLTSLVKKCEQAQVNQAGITGEEKHQLNHIYEAIKSIDQQLDQAISSQNTLIKQINKYLIAADEHHKASIEHIEQLSALKQQLGNLHDDFDKQAKDFHQFLLLVQKFHQFCDLFDSAKEEHILHCIYQMRRIIDEENIRFSAHSTLDQKDKVIKKQLGALYQLCYELEKPILLLLENEYLDKDIDECIQKLRLFAEYFDKTRLPICVREEAEILYNYLKTEYLDIVKSKTYATQKKMGRTVLQGIKSCEIELIQDQLIREILYELESLLEQAVNDDYELEYKWWTQDHFNEFLTYHRLLAKIQSYRMQVEGKLAGVYLLP